MTLTVFYTSVSGNPDIKKKQQSIIFILEGKKIPFRLVDISQKTEDKESMRKLAGDNTALPPQICNGDQYCGDYDAFYGATEQGTLLKFLKLEENKDQLWDITVQKCA